MMTTSICPPRFGTQRTPSRRTLGPAIAKTAELLGKPFMPWQRIVADVLGEIDDETGQLAYDEFGLTVPRQSGKSIFVLAKATHRCSATAFFGGAQQALYTAQTRKDARKKFEVDYAAVLEASAYFKHKADPRWGNGNEHIRFPNGSRFGIEANTEKAGHGGTLDEGYIDEAFAQVDSRLEQAFRPSMITRRNKQLGWISTAGWSDGSPYLKGKVRRGRAQVESRANRGLAYFEWSAPEGADPGDEAMWQTCMPALGHTISVAAIRSEYETALAEGKLDGFRRAYLNLWVPKPKDDEVDWVIPEPTWLARLSPDSHITSRPSFAIDVSPLREWSSIAAAGTSTAGGVQVEVTWDGETMDHRPGTDWVVARMTQIGARLGVRKVTIQSGQAAEALVPELEAAGFEVVKLNGPETAAACGSFHDLATSGRLAHLGQSDLDAALACAKRLDRDGYWLWGRKKSGDITPIVAATLAAATHVATQSDNYDAADSIF